MKKVFCLVSILIMILIGCSRVSEQVWPKQVKGEDFSATRIDKTFTGQYLSSFMEYLEVSETQVLDESAVIAKVEIIEEPVEYKLSYKMSEDSTSELYLLAFHAKILKVFYSDSPLEEGQTIQFLRQEYSTSTSDPEYRSFDSATVQLQNKSQYILFLTRPETLHKESSFLDASYSVADYFCKDPCRTIIICNDDGSYELDANFTSLTGGAEDSDSPYGMQMVISRDEAFEENVQKLADSKK